MDLLVDATHIGLLSVFVTVTLAALFLLLCQFWGNQANSIWKAVVTFLLALSVYALAKTQGATILAGLWGVVLAYGFLVRKSFALPPLRFRVDLHALGIGLLFISILALLQVYSRYDPDTHTFLHNYSDEYIYAYIVKGMRDFGAELPYAQLENFVITGNTYNSPYHYPDLWAVSLLSEFLPISTVYIFQFILYPLVQFVLFLQCFYVLKRRNAAWFSGLAALFIVLIPGNLQVDNFLTKTLHIPFFDQYLGLSPTNYKSNLKISLMVMVFLFLLTELEAKRYASVLLISIVGLYMNYILLPFLALFWAYILVVVDTKTKMRYAATLAIGYMPFILVYSLLNDKSSLIIVYPNVDIVSSIKANMAINHLNTVPGMLVYIKDVLLRIETDYLTSFYYLFAFSILLVWVQAKSWVLKAALVPVFFFHLLVGLAPKPALLLVACGGLYIAFHYRKHPWVRFLAVALTLGMGMYVVTTLFLSGIINAFQLFIVVVPALVWATMYLLLATYIKTKTTWVLVPLLLLVMIDEPQLVRAMATDVCKPIQFLTPELGPKLAAMLEPNTRIGFLETLPNNGHGGHLIYFNAWFNIYTYTNKPTLHPIQWGDLHPKELPGIIAHNGGQFLQYSSTFQFVQHHPELTKAQATLLYIKQNNISWLIADDPYLHNDYPYLLPVLAKTDIHRNPYTFYKVLQ